VNLWTIYLYMNSDNKIKKIIREELQKITKEGYGDVSLEYTKKSKKLSDYNYSDKKDIGDFVLLNFKKKDKDWYLFDSIMAFDKFDGTEVANASYGKQHKHSVLKSTIDVRPDKRRLGIASEIYKWIEELTGEIIHPEPSHSESAEKFWSQPNRKFGTINENLDFSDKDLYDIAVWGLQGDYSFSGCWDESDEDLELAADCAVEDFKLFLNQPYPMGLGSIPSNPIIYRFLRLKSLEDLRNNELGVSWFSNPKQHEVPGFFDMLDYLKPWKTREGEVYLIKAQTSINNIDIPNTLWQRSTQWIENEIVIKDDSSSKIKILDIKKASEL